MVMFHSYVSLPEGKCMYIQGEAPQTIAKLVYKCNSNNSGLWLW